MAVTPIPYPEYDRPPATQHNAALRSAEHAIYTHKRALAEEHYLRTGHDAAAIIECDTCAFIVSGTSADTRRMA